MFTGHILSIGILVYIAASVWRKKSLYGHDGLILIPPPPSEIERIKELEGIQHQYYNRVVPPYLQQAFDEAHGDVFNDFLKSEGIRDQRPTIKKWHNSVLIPVLLHKTYFNSPRPHQLAQKYNIPFSYDKLKTTQTASYPSGHTTQAYYVALHLSDLYPHLRERFFDIAEGISNSRIDRGVHFPSDIEGGKLLAQALYEKSLQ